MNNEETYQPLEICKKVKHWEREQDSKSLSRCPNVSNNSVLGRRGWIARRVILAARWHFSPVKDTQDCEGTGQVRQLRCVNPTFHIHPQATTSLFKTRHDASDGNSFAFRAMANHERARRRRFQRFHFHKIDPALDVTVIALEKLCASHGWIVAPLQPDDRQKVKLT